MTPTQCVPPCHPLDLHPAGLTVYISAMVVSGIAVGVRGFSWWYQLLIVIAGSLAITGLWLTYLTDPGALTPAAHQGRRTAGPALQTAYHLHYHTCTAMVVPRLPVSATCASRPQEGFHMQQHPTTWHKT
eukprot:GHRR01027999.1.p1 GENE.GHRR01027999.1~~GHRR01027999.1.p1  ORF type:complete len:130 (+),score=26.07 GHRR01027999.1:675-1064(+)